MKQNQTKLYVRPVVLASVSLTVERSFLTASVAPDVTGVQTVGQEKDEFIEMDGTRTVDKEFNHGWE